MAPPVKKAAAVIAVAALATALSVACASAQMGPGNPTGGTACRQYTEEARSGLGTVGLLSRTFTLPPTWQGMIGSFVASQYANSFIARPTDVRSQVAARRITRR